MGFPRQAYWSGLTFPAPGDLPDPGFKPEFPALTGNSLPADPWGTYLFILNILASNQTFGKDHIEDT